MLFVLLRGALARISKEDTRMVLDWNKIGPLLGEAVVEHHKAEEDEEYWEDRLVYLAETLMYTFNFMKDEDEE